MSEIKTYNKRNIKRFKGRLATIEYEYAKRGLNYVHKRIGIITANSGIHILFKIRGEDIEHAIKYTQIINIEITKK